ncbi:hypothetical protein C8R43DRAFT_1049664 [Mycena crocata]|nr:hypothetical protein C8R43DRAFT_1049664 [Mycena crocata]
MLLTHVSPSPHPLFSVPSNSTLPPFQPRKHHPGPPIPPFNARASKFHAIRSRLPPLNSHAACARFRLSRKPLATLHHLLDEHAHNTRLRAASTEQQLDCLCRRLADLQMEIDAYDIFHDIADALSQQQALFRAEAHNDALQLQSMYSVLHSESTFSSPSSISTPAHPAFVAFSLHRSLP